MKIITLVLAVGLAGSPMCAQPSALPLWAFGAGYGVQTGGTDRVVGFAGQPVVGRTSGSGNVVSSGFLAGVLTLSGGPTGVGLPPEIPHEFALHQNYPNPFNPATNIVYGIRSREQVELTVFDILGRKVATLVNEVQEPGKYAVSFAGNRIASGVYIYTLRAGEFVSTKKMMLLR